MATSSTAAPAPLPFLRHLLLAALLVGLVPVAARAQLGTLASPGPLSKAHASLEGLSKCQSCHEPGRQVTAAKCLSCHQPIANRMAQKKGIHRDVTTDCAGCHVEHHGEDAELRPMDVKRFDHRAETGFALDGRHQGLACARCHTTRSFLAAKPDCASCHADPHKGSLGSNCATCHPTAVPFTQASQRFDHTKAAFQLTGGHQQVACAKCHVNGKFKGIAFSTCASCHKDPHSRRLAADCATCHTTSQWKTTRIDHDKTAYRLLGKHETVPCARCHVQSAVKVRLKYGKCADCHADPHKGRFKDACETCHTVKGFGGASFDHTARTKFPLTGKHATIECTRCHKRPAPAPARTGAVLTAAGARPPHAVDFTGLKVACTSCHEDPHKGELGANCATCHGTESFKLATYTHQRVAAFFGGEHARATCAGCHARGPQGPPTPGTSVPVAQMTFRNVPTACATCHKDVHLGQLGTACDGCHRIDAAKFAAPGFSHDRSTFRLTGKHQQVACEKCHPAAAASFPAGTGEARRYKGLGTDCLSCHEDVHLGQLGKRCDACHKTDGFKMQRYTHLKPEGFFVGGHLGLECVQCHKKADAVFPAGRGVAVKYLVGTACTACHEDAHAGAMGSACASCHTPDVWRNPNRSFHKTTDFPLTGRHLAVSCESCHVQGQLKGTPTRCYDCHWVRRQDDLYQTRLGNECQDCHRTSSWTAVNWDHGQRTGTALNIAHRLLACDSCHKGRVFEGRSPECIACHEPEFRRTRTPDHAAAGFPVDCRLCHSASAPTFAGARFTHASYSLRGVHATQTCAACHGTGVYQGTPRQCAACHQDEYQRTTRPNHASAGFPIACEQCHREGGPGWGGSGAGFNHAAFYPLLGSHQGAACTACHVNGVYKGTTHDCFSCHQADYRSTRNPNHVAGGFSTACATCHREGGPGWVTTSFRHTSAFPLTGLHQSTACSTCHTTGDYKSTSRACFSCHEADFRRTTAPNHASAGFSTSCEQCHRSGGPGWGSGSFNHNSFFALAGRHQTTACTSCHRNGQYKGTARECYACHQTEYQRATNPSHQSAGFPTTCADCHRSGGPGWTGASFNHASFFPLVGRHAAQACSACHRNGVYRGTPRDCVGCHLARYQATRDPNHAAAGFPTTCETCHRAADTSWSQGRFNHTWFPITSGNHAGHPCSACHQVPNNYRQFTCLTCHTRSDTDPEHEGRSGYRYESAACYSCHPTGRGD